ncbi:MAG: DJ-1/PfpI family protein [Actinobacteria bacterium]|nr:DJ-1/PfpI family protein [Actinomycetota bacterium]MCG2808162.1 DJ-1/PfpI family protein [Coriobacteriia bacterium]
MPAVLMVIAPEMFRDEEYEHPREVLERRGATVTVASMEPGICKGRFGLTAVADIALRDASAEEYDAVVFVGGKGAQVFFDDQTAQGLAASMYKAGKIVSAICIAPTILARAGLLSGKRATSFPSQEDVLRAAGALYTGNPVQTEGRIVTGIGPESAYGFGEAVADAMSLPSA